eukprot:TRINITY_DN7186_c0_g1_i11.p1 TRINITY_DN7186_c0_g1~~TRINITY_DN7186_c0_g1_i11.p1  ORF type:complete len:196 (-),score=45.76 TRINITY_DN7186_c0_g1_i11:1516-2103(-)
MSARTKLPSLRTSRYRSNVRPLLKSNSRKSPYPLLLPLIGHKVVYKGRPILDERETREAIGVGVKSLAGALGGKSGEGYLKILQGRNRGLFTGEEKSDLCEMKESERKDILVNIKHWMKRRNMEKFVKNESRNHKRIDKSLPRNKRLLSFRSYVGKKLLSDRCPRNNPLERLYNKVSAQFDTYSQELGVDNYSSQ